LRQSTLQGAYHAASADDTIDPDTRYPTLYLKHMMTAKRTIPILALIVLFLLPSCGTGGATGGNSLLGR
jgi:hypothetical protein